MHIDNLEAKIKNTVKILESSKSSDNTETLDTLGRLITELNEIHEEDYNKRIQDLKVSNLFSEEKPSKEFSNSIYRPRTKASYSQVYKGREGKDSVLLTTQSEVELEFNEHFHKK